MPQPDLRGVCPHCGHHPLSFYFAPHERSSVLAWREDGTPERVAMVVNDYERPTREVSPGEVEASERAMEEARGGATLHCTSCARWFERAEIQARETDVS